MNSFTPGPWNKIRRPDRADYDKAAIYAVLDEGLVAHVGFIADDRPFVIPMAYGRIGNRLYLHGAKAARFAKAMAGGMPICVTVTLADGIVVGRSAFHCSMNYRSVVAHGSAHLVENQHEATSALAAITDHLLPGRWQESRPVTAKEIRATTVLGMDIEAASLKSRAGPPVDDDEDYELPIWAGVVPLRQVAGEAVNDGKVQLGVEQPASVGKRLDAMS
jgi:nitroimidazol reductase NimA-like FMN-containing flavoprotein (pyridoxamine 5'-phosphate oxidase superfamily)